MYIKRNGKYFLEDIRCYHLVPKKEDATECIDFKDAEAYIKLDMELQLNQVSIEWNGSIYKYSDRNKEWYNHDTHYICDRCGKIDSRFNQNPVRTINGEEEICFKCLEALDDSEESWEANV